VIGVARVRPQCGAVGLEPVLQERLVAGLNSTLTYGWLPSADDKCLLNSFLKVGDKLLIA
jgi:hypothetical protein